MSFLDNTGLAYFYSKLKEKFIRSINNTTPDANGNVAITNVATADNLTSPDGWTSFDSYIYRTSGGDISLDSGEARLLYIEGNNIVTDREEEVLTTTINNNLTATIDAATWRASNYGDESGDYTFNYTSSNSTWTPALNTYGITVTGTHESSISASVSGSLTSATVTKATWETQITTTGIYFFNYEDDVWKLNNNSISLQSYGIVITEEPAAGDVITIDYTAATPNSTLIVHYEKKEQGTIHVATPTAFSATGFNQFDKTSMVLSNMTISNGYIVDTSNKYICYCKAVGGVTNGYVAYSESGAIENIGWCDSIPQESSPVITTNNNVTSTLASIPFNEDGYVVVVTTDINDICIHPKWSGSADTQYEEYVNPSVITFPTTGTLNGATVSLPLATYGIPSVGSVADKMDLEKGIYIKNIGRYGYSAENLVTVQNMNVEYDYDDTNIFYVLTSPITYTIEVNPIYTVNDFGTEEFIGTSIPVIGQTLYGQNLRDKLRLDVELKKLLFENVEINGGFVLDSDNTYTDYRYKKPIPLTGVTSEMVPQVIFNVTEAISGVFAPVATSYNGGIILYANTLPTSSFIIPTIICWRENTN